MRRKLFLLGTLTCLIASAAAFAVVGRSSAEAIPPDDGDLAEVLPADAFSWPSTDLQVAPSAGVNEDVAGPWRCPASTLCLWDGDNPATSYRVTIGHCASPVNLGRVFSDGYAWNDRANSFWNNTPYDVGFYHHTSGGNFHLSNVVGRWSTGHLSDDLSRRLVTDAGEVITVPPDTDHIDGIYIVC